MSVRIVRGVRKIGIVEKEILRLCGYNSKDSLLQFLSLLPYSSMARTPDFGSGNLCSNRNRATNKNS